MKRQIVIFLMLLFSHLIIKAQSSDNPCNMRWTNVATPLSTSLGNLMYQVQYPQNCGCGWPQVALGHTFPFPVKLAITLRGIKCDGTTGESGFSTGGNEVASGYIHKENNQGNWHVFKQIIKTVAAEVRYTQNGDNYRFYYDEDKGINTVQETINGLSVAEYNARRDQQNSKNTASNSNNNSSDNSSQNGSSYHTAMNANDPRGNTGNSASQQEVQRQEQLNMLNQKLNYQAQNYNNVADAVKSLANLLIGSMTQHFINEDIKGRNERFAELQNKVNTKPGTLVDCSECSGQGYFTCTDCNGNGYKGDGNERTICTKCNGLGKTQCVHCRGTGEEFKEDFEAEYGRKSSISNNDNSTTDNTQQNNTGSGSNGSINNDGYNSDAQNALAEGWKYSRQGNYSSAIIYFEQADKFSASCVNRRTQLQYSNSAKLNLGYAYRGLKDDIRAISYFEKITDDIDPNSLMTISGLEAIAEIYSSGKNNLPQDLQKATIYYEKAAEIGSRSAMNELGNIYLKKGRTDGKFYAMALNYFTKAAEPNYVFLRDHSYVIPSPEAMKSIGNIYENALGVTKDLHIALSWYNKAFALVQQMNGKDINNIDHTAGITLAFPNDLKKNIDKDIARVKNKLRK